MKGPMKQEGAVQVLKRDALWSKSKDLISKKPDHPDRLSHTQFDLTNFDQPLTQPHPVKTAILNKREQKA